MHAIWALISLLLGFALEGEAVRQAWAGVPHGSAWPLFLHLAGSVLGAFGIAALLPFSIRQRTSSLLRRWGLFAVLIACMPGIGLPGSLLAILPALHRPKARGSQPWRPVTVPELPFRPIESVPHAQFGIGGLPAALTRARDPQRRIRAVIATRQIVDQLAVPLLQQALTDPADDVRMFAYAILDSKERKLNNRIGSLLKELDPHMGDAQLAAIHYALAQSYWEMVFLGLAAGYQLDHALEKAAHHALKAAEKGWAGADIEFLIGRIQLKQGRLQEAERSFKSAMHDGALASAVLPFLAEIAFEHRDYRRARKLLGKLHQITGGHASIPLVVRSWRCGT